MAFAQAQGRTAHWADAHTLKVDGPLVSHRFVIDVPFQRGIQLLWEAPLIAIAEHTAAMLEALGASVLLTGGANDPESIGQRSRSIREFGTESMIFLRAGKHASTHIRGLRTQVASRSFLRSRRLAEALLTGVALRTGMPSRGIPLLPGLPGELDALAGKVGAPSVMVECGCVTCPADEALLQQPGFQVRFACGLTEGILRFLDLPESIVAALHLEEVALESGALAPGSDVEPEVLLQAPVAVAEPVLSVEAARPEEMAPLEEPAARAAPVTEAPVPEAPVPEAPAPAAVVLTGPQSEPPPPAPARPEQSAAKEARVLNRNERSRRREPKRGPARQQWPPMPQSESGEGPEPMIRTPDGNWISPKAYAILRQQQAQQQASPQHGLRQGPDGRIEWPGLPPGFSQARR